VRRKLAAAVTTVAALIGCAACTSAAAHKGAAASHRPGSPGHSLAGGAASAPASVDATPGATGVTAVPAGGSSRFCYLVHKVGLDNLSLTETAGTSLNATKLLAGVDELDAAAPAEIKHDFHIYDKFEHALLDPGSPSGPNDLGSSGPPLALEHVAEYLSHNCAVG
jgi:hypothetical protein